MTELRPFVRQSGDSVRKPWFIKQRKLLDYIAVFIGSGKGVFSIDGESSDMEPGSLFWVPPGTLNEMRGTSPEMRCLFIHFDLLYDPARSHWDAFVLPGTEDLSEFSACAHPPLKDPVISQWRGKLPISARSAQIFDIFVKIAAEHGRNQTHSLKLSAYILELVSEIRAGIQTGKSGDARLFEKMEKAASYIHISCGDASFEIRKAAKKFGMSETHFRRTFKKICGACPGAMLTEARISRARNLLACSDMSVTDIAESCGYKSIYDFSRSFKRECGCSPRQFRG